MADLDDEIYQIRKDFLQIPTYLQINVWQKGQQNV